MLHILHTHLLIQTVPHVLARRTSTHITWLQTDLVSIIAQTDFPVTTALSPPEPETAVVTWAKVHSPLLQRCIMKTMPPRLCHFYVQV